MFGNQLKKQAQLRESLLAFVAIAVICYGVYSLFYTPRSTRNQELSTQLQEFKNKKANLEDLVVKLRQKVGQKSADSGSDLEAAVSQNPKLAMLQKSRNPDFKKISDFLNAVTRDATKPNTSVNGVSYEEPQTREGYSATKFHLHVSGHFADLIDLIKTIEDKAALMTLDKIHMLVDKDDSSRVSLEIEGTFYQLRNEDV